MRSGQSLPHALPVAKYQALGNSYIVLDPRNLLEGDCARLAFNEAGFPRRELIEILCDPGRGIGSNGVLFGPLAGSADPDIYGLRIINSDGTLAGFSGNGARIFAKYLLDNGDLQNGASIRLDIDEGFQKPDTHFVRVRILNQRDGRIEITAPQSPRFGAEAVSLKRGHDENTSPGAPSWIHRIAPIAEIGRKITGDSTAWATSVLVDIGNPHCVTIVSRSDQLPTLSELKAQTEALSRVAYRQTQANALFEKGINLQWLYPEKTDRVRLMIYERGEGPTLASGSSAAAAVCAAYRCGLVDEFVQVNMPGGSLDVRIENSHEGISSVTLSGFASRIFKGEFDINNYRDGLHELH